MAVVVGTVLALGSLTLAGPANGNGPSGSVVVSAGRAVQSAPAPSMSDGNAVVRVSLDRLPSSGHLYAGLQVRHTGPAGYQPRVRIGSDGSLAVGVVRRVGGQDHTVVAATSVPGRAVAGRAVLLEGRAAGGVVHVRAWVEGASVPGWQATHRDPSPIAGHRPVALWTYLSGGSHQVTVSYSNFVVTPSGPAPAPAPAPPPPAPPAPAPVQPPSSGIPGAATTGVPSGVALRVHRGNLVITQPGTYDALDVHGFVEVRASNVTLSRSLVRGGQQSGNRGLVTVYGDVRNVVVTDSDIVPDHPSVWYDGIKGNNFTARRVDIRGTVDGVKIHGNNVSVEDSWIHDLRYFASDPNQGGGPTHNDGVQVLGGSNIRLHGNRIEGARNAALQVTQDFAKVVDLRVTDNLMGNGDCSIKLQHKKLTVLDSVTVTGNRFLRNTTQASCAILLTNSTRASMAGNVWHDDGSAVSPRVWG